MNGLNSLKNIQMQLSRAGLDALILTDEKNLRYAFGCLSKNAVGLITEQAALLIAEAASGCPADKEDFRCILAESQTEQDTSLCRLVESLQPRSIGFANGIAAVDHREADTDLLRYSTLLGRTLIDAVPFMTKLRSCKSTAELELLTAAQRIAERALDDVLGMIVPGITEREIAQALDARMLAYGAEGIAFETIAITGSKTAIPHGVPGADTVHSGDFVLMDFGCIWNGYCSDMTRTVAVGKASPQMRRIYDIVREAQARGIEAAAVGAGGREIDAVARKVIEEAGYGQYFITALGHSVGLDVHEFPIAAPRSTDIMEPGMVITVEPGIYLPDAFGVRIEDLVAVGQGGGSTLAKATKELLVL